MTERKALDVIILFCPPIIAFPTPERVLALPPIIALQASVVLSLVIVLPLPDTKLADGRVS
jgi:hypothetical protein